MARQGAMVAYQGAIDFAFQGGGVGKFLKKALTGEGVPLMRCTGRGDLFLADDASEIHLIDLDGDSVTVNGRNVLAFEPGLQWDIRRVEGASMFSGGIFNTVFTGRGRLAVTAYGTGCTRHQPGADVRRHPVGNRLGRAICRRRSGVPRGWVR